ncbi:phage tail tape measure protein [uncultured Pseudomonas sp.]|uniref:phage tail tape measure protein n=1 Tax=uncultured Pseudomonas sp. TaxID=114707 RepID=UPI00261844BE|nr:phage tail tape measure protein [uncultured Pseudomonas sp.]
MAESKYSLRLVAQDAFSSTFGDFKKKSKGFEETLKGQQAELRKLNAQAKDMAGLVKLQEQLKGTEEALKKAREEQARLGREHDQAKTKSNELAAAYVKAAAATKLLEESTSASKAEVNRARAEQNRLGRELDVVTGSLRKLDAQQDKASAGVSALERVIRRERDELGRLDASLTKAGVDTSKLTSEQARLKAATESVNAALQGQRAKLDAVSAAQKRVDGNKAARADLRGQFVETAAVGYLASRPIDKAMELETAMADVGKVINFEGDQREEMAAANLRMASDRLIASSGMTAVDLAKIEYAAGQSGIGNDEKTAEGKQARVMEFTRDAAIMGSAFDIDAKTAGETMAGWQASMRLDRAKTLDLADSVNYLGNNFNATAADIAAVVKRFGAVGSASGLSPEQSAALSAALLNPGTEKEIAGTGFKNFTSALVAGKSATKGEKAQWAELGFDPEELARDMQTNAPQTIMTVLKAIRDQPREEQAAIATTLFGSESIGAIQPLLENLDPLEKAFGMVGDKSKYATSQLGDMGSMMQEAAGVANTSRTGWNAFTARLTRLSTVVGNAMLPVLNAVLVPLGALVDGFSWAAETFPNLTGTLAVAAAGIAALNVGALGLKFVGLLFGQTFNRAGLAKAKMDLATAQTATSATAALTRLNGALNGLGSGGGGLEGRKAKRKGRRGSRASAAGPAAQNGANAARAALAAKAVADGAGAAKGVAEGAGAARGLGGTMATAKGLMGPATKLVGKASVPLVLATSGYEVVQGIAEGDGRAVSSGLGSAGGGLAGAWAGGAAGAAIGSFVPVIGTAIGGVLGAAIGGFLGSEAGSAIAEGFYGLFEDTAAEKAASEGPGVAAKPLSESENALPAAKADLAKEGGQRLLKPDTLEAPPRLGVPSQVGKEVVTAAAAAAAPPPPPPPVFPPIHIVINGQDQATAQALVDKVMQRIKTEMMPMFNPLTARSGAMLTDGVD